MNWYEKFVVPLWREYKIWGFVIVVVLLAALAWLFDIPVADGVKVLWEKWVG